MCRSLWLTGAGACPGGVAFGGRGKQGRRRPVCVLEGERERRHVAGPCGLERSSGCGGRRAQDRCGRHGGRHGGVEIEFPKPKIQIGFCALVPQLRGGACHSLPAIHKRAGPMLREGGPG